MEELKSINKEFLYESELKEIEEKFGFKFDYLNLEKNDNDYEIVHTILDGYAKKKIKNIMVFPCGILINFFEHRKGYLPYKFDKSIHDGNIVEAKCNTLLEIERNKYLKEFYDKYKGKIVKDNVYEDDSYYYKLLKE